MTLRSPETVPVPAGATAHSPEVNVWAAWWRAVSHFDPAKVQPWVALRNAVGITLPLAIGVSIGSAPSGLIATTGALNVSFTDNSDPYHLRAKRMLAAAAICSVAVVSGGLSSQHGALATAVLAVWAFAAGMMVALDIAAADIGVISLVTLAVFSGQPVGTEEALWAGVLAFAGGILQILLAVALWPVRRFEPERRVLGSFYRELARVAKETVSPVGTPPATHESTRARHLIGETWFGRTIQGERYLLLVSQAERIRLALLMLRRIHTRLGREAESADAGAILNSCLGAAAAILDGVAESLETASAAFSDLGWMALIHESAEQLRLRASEHNSASVAMIADARHQVDALSGQLRAAIELVAASTPAGRAAFELREAGRPTRLRLAGTFATLRANLTLRSPALQHAIRLAVCIAVGQGIARALQLGRGYWVPMTIAIVLKPEFTATFSRGVVRVAGTVLGLVIATVLFHLYPPAPFLEVLLVGALAFVIRCYGPANYGIVVVAVSGMVVLMFALLGVAPNEVIAERGWNTLLGGLLALVVYAVWPTWERSQVSNTLAQMLDAYRSYFRVVRENYLHPHSSYDTQLGAARMEARLARTNVEASVERFGMEPGASPDRMQRLNAMLASSHRLVHAIMALEAGLAGSQPIPARPAFAAFANHVEVTLHALARSLRGSAVRKENLPDLREDHHALVNSGDLVLERYALVNVETDRVTNSLNTLAAQVLSWK